MKTQPDREPLRAFTLVELLVVIAIIGILAGLLVPVVIIQIKKAKVMKAQNEMMGMVTAITAYASEYSMMPAPPNARSLATDLTWGTTNTSVTGATVVNGGAYEANNSEIIAILADIETNRNGTATVNAGHVLNPRRVAYLKFNYSSHAGGPGVGDDGVYRDPWGNPYIISLDLNADHAASDAWYRYDAVSLESGIKGYNGMTRAVSGTTDNFVGRGNIVIWSFGPDGKIDPTAKANVPPNADNIVMVR